MRSPSAVFAASLIWMLGLACTPAAEEKPPIHPLVFAMVEGWLADSNAPVVTEINLDAVAAGRNQFDPEAVKRDGEWITCRHEEGFVRYQVTKTVGGRQTVRFQQNGGGTFTSESFIEFEIVERQLETEGKKLLVRVLRVLRYWAKEP